MMEIKGTWTELKEKIKNKFIALRDDDLLFSDGKQDEILGRLQIKLGKTREELLAIIKSM